MRIKTVQWNIGGGKIRKRNDDPHARDVYLHDGLDHMVGILKKIQPNIIAIQENHENKRFNFAREIARALDLKYLVSDVYDKSHLEEGLGLGQAIISEFPLKNHTFVKFYNPKLEIIGPDGKKWIMHNKGLTSATVNLDKNCVLHLMTLHLMPFRRFGLDPKGTNTKKVWQDLQKKLGNAPDYLLLQGDFNLNFQRIKRFIPKFFENGVSEVVQKPATAPKNRRYDHVLYKGLKLISSKVENKALTDHYPIFSEFEI